MSIAKIIPKIKPISRSDLFEFAIDLYLILSGISCFPARDLARIVILNVSFEQKTMPHLFLPLSYKHGTL
jgi:hypothetical protein